MERAVIATLLRFLNSVTLRAGLVGRMSGAQRSGDLIMTFSSLSLNRQASAGTEGFEIDKIRALVAKHLEVDVSRVTDEAHFIDDLGADWLDRLELMIIIEDRFGGLEITDDDADQIRVVGDLIRYVENWVNTGQKR